MMKDKFLYISGLNICYGDEKRESDYINNYRKSVTDIEKQKDWKTSGASAQFQGRTAECTEINARVTGVSAYTPEKFIYSAAAGDISGIMEKEYGDGHEQYLVHDNKYVFSGVQYVKDKEIVLVSVADSRQTNHIARYIMKTNDLEIMTSGDSSDENPSYHDGRIYFNSRGVGRNENMELAGYGPSGIFCLDENGNCEEVLSEEGFDLMAPKKDGAGNLYYIKKPYKQIKGKSGFAVLGEVLLFPFRLVYNFMRLFVFLANIGRKSDKQSSSGTSGANPAVTPEKSEREIFILGERIKLQEEEKANEKRKDKNAGYAPARFELWKQGADGVSTKIKSGVFAFDLDESGNLVFTNGKYIIKTENGAETVLHKDKLITNVKAQ